MKSILTGAVAASALLCTSVAFAAPLKLTPATKSPKSGGLSVKYAWAGDPPARIQSLNEAKQMLGGAKAGPPLRGLDYADTNKGDPVMTHEQHYNVAADIRGYIKFDAPGIYELETWSNDGIEARIGGQVVGKQPTRSGGCDPNQRVEVEVPKAGWYPLQIQYFQKYGTSCLMMKWGKKGEKLKWVPNNAFGR